MEDRAFRHRLRHLNSLSVRVDVTAAKKLQNLIWTLNCIHELKGSGHWTPSHFRCSELTASKANPSPVECCDQSHLPHQVNLISFCTSPISNSQWPSPPFFPSILWSQSSLSWITPYSWYLSSTFEKPRQQGQKIWHGERRRQPEQPNGDVDNTAGASFSVVLFTTLLSRHPHILKGTKASLTQHPPNTGTACRSPTDHSELCEVPSNRL